MVKKIVLYIFIYILSIGCDSHCYINCPEIDSYEESQECFFESYLELDAPTMYMDENGYYIFQLNYTMTDGYTFVPLDADVGLQYQMIHWETDEQFNLPWQGTNNYSDLVNTMSYTGMDGVGHTMLGAWNQLIGDTIVVTCSYSYCDSSYINLMRIIIE